MWRADPSVFLVQSVPEIWPVYNRSALILVPERVVPMLSAMWSTTLPCAIVRIE